MSEVINVRHDKDVSTVTFANPPMNLMDIEIMDALVAAHRDADAHPGTRVIVTRSGLDGIFSHGLNPPLILQCDEDGRVAFFHAVGRLIAGLFSLGKPHISVVNGPALAGGAVIAICSDFRYFDAALGAICFAEPKVGLPVPGALAAVIREVCAPRLLREVVMLGKHIDADLALEAGLADGIAEGGALEAMVEKQVARLARLSPAGLRTTKAGLRQTTLERIAAQGQAEMKNLRPYMGGDFLGEGLNAVLEGRRPVFKR